MGGFECACVSGYSILGGVCSRTVCSSLDEIEDGTISYSLQPMDGGFVPGTIASYECGDLLLLTGAATRVCQSNREWTGTAPTCQLIMCDALDPPANGDITYSPDQDPPYDALTEAVYSCNAGYKLSHDGNEVRTCVSNELGSGGEWTGTAPTCEPIQCPALPELNFVIAYTMAADPDFPIGTIAIHICNAGTTLQDVDRVFRSCSPDGSWSGEEPVCQELPTGCPDIPDPEDGNIDFIGDSTAPFDAGTSAIYSCDSGYSLVDDTVRVCTADGIDFIWSGGVPSCLGITCPPIEAPANGNVDYNEEPDASGNYPFETVASFSCSEGYGLEGDSSSACIGDGSSLLGEFYPNPPTCELITCPALDNPQNGEVSYDAVDTETLPFGTVATYSCDPGHFLEGEATRVCTGDGSSVDGYFSGTEPTCQEITCPVLEAPEYGSIEFSSGTEGPYDIGIVATYSCDEGFSLENGDEERTCQQDGGSETGVWSGMAPKCIGTCQPLSSITDGVISYSMEADENNEYLADTVANYTCNDGFELFGDYMRMCQNNMTWTGMEPSCLIACPSLDEIEYGTIEFSSKPNAAGNYYRSTFAAYSCDIGFNIRGVDTRLCQDDMTWSGEAPTCERIMCSDLPDPSYGDIEYMNDTTAPFELDTEAVYICNEGFVLVGDDDIRVCMSTGASEGVWSGTAPSCQAVTCPELPLPPNVAGIEYTNPGTPDYPYLTEAEYSCEEGFKLTSGDYVRICVMNGVGTTGVWSGQEPVCSPIVATCPDIPNPVNGRIEFEGDSLSPFELGTVAKYICDLGYAILEGNDSRTCEMDGFSAIGVWSGEAPYCVAVIECPLLEAPVNGSIIYSVGPEDGLGFGVTATYSCDVEGQGLSGGDIVRVCGPYYDYYRQHDLVGKWSGSAPTCELIRCRDIADPYNGQIEFSPDRRAPFDYGTTAEYSCEAGYELSDGDHVRMCTGDNRSAEGVWTGEGLTCESFAIQ